MRHCHHHCHWNCDQVVIFPKIAELTQLLEPYSVRWLLCGIGSACTALPDSILGASMFRTRVRQPRHIWLTGSARCNQEAGGNSVCLVFQKGRGVRYFVKEYLLCFSSFQIVFNVYLRYIKFCQRVRRCVHDYLTKLLVMRCDEAHALWDYILHRGNGCHQWQVPVIL